MSVKSTFNMTFKGTEDISTAEVLKAVHEMTVAESRADGTGTSAVDGVWSNLALSLASTSTTLDLQSLTDSFGNALSFQKIFWMAIQNKDTSNELKVGAAVANQWEPFVSATGDIVVVPANGWFVWANTTGATVDATNKDLKLDSPSATIAVEIMVIGTKS